MSANSNQKERPIVEVLLESGDILGKTLSISEFLYDVPVLGLAFKVFKAGYAIRDRIFASKLMEFLRGIENMTENQKATLKERIKANPEEGRKVGETLFLVLEQMTDLEKHLLLSKIFLAYIDGMITGDELRRLAQAINAAFFDDLKQLLVTNEFPEEPEESWMEFLVASGFTRKVNRLDFDHTGTFYYEITPLAKKLKEAVPDWGNPLLGTTTKR